MEYIDHIDSEGGPFLLADAVTAQSWRGAEGDGSDYERACHSLLPDAFGAMISIGKGSGIIWDLDGAGTVDVYFKTSQHLQIVHAWIEELNDITAIDALAELPLENPITIGNLEIHSGVLAILWSPESGECIESLQISESSRPTGEMASDSSGLLVKIANGNYSCLHDEVKINDEIARRCHLILVA